MHNFFISLGFQAKSFNEKFKFYFSNPSILFLFYLQFYTELSTIDMQEVHVQKINTLYWILKSTSDFFNGPKERETVKFQ